MFTLLTQFNLSEEDLLSSDLSRLIFESINKEQQVEEKRFSEKDWVLICELLNNPPKPNKKLQKAYFELKKNCNGL